MHKTSPIKYSEVSTHYRGYRVESKNDSGRFTQLTLKSDKVNIGLLMRGIKLFEYIIVMTVTLTLARERVQLLKKEATTGHTYKRVPCLKDVIPKTPTPPPPPANQDELNRLRAELTSAQNSLQQAKSNLQAEILKATAIQKERDKAIHDKINAESARDQANQNSQQAALDLSTANKNLKASEAQLAQIKVDLQKATQDKQKAEQGLATAQGTLKKAQEEAQTARYAKQKAEQELQAERSKPSNQPKGGAGQDNKHAKDISDAQAKLKEAERKASEAEKALKTAEQNLAAERTKVQTAERNASEAEKSQKTAEKGLATAQAKLKEAESKASFADEAKRKAEQGLANETVKLEAAERNASEALKAQDKMKETLMQALANLQSSETEISDIKKELGTTKAELASTQALQANPAAHRNETEFHGLEQALARAHAQVAQLMLKQLGKPAKMSKEEIKLVKSIALMIYTTAKVSQTEIKLKDDCVFRVQGVKDISDGLTKQIADGKDIDLEQYTIFDLCIVAMKILDPDKGVIRTADRETIRKLKLAEIDFTKPEATNQLKHKLDELKKGSPRLYELVESLIRLHKAGFEKQWKKAVPDATFESYVIGSSSVAKLFVTVNEMDPVSINQGNAKATPLLQALHKNFDQLFAGE